MVVIKISKKIDILNENLVLRKYKARGSSMPPKRNVIYISKNNSIKHELAKCLVAIMIRKGYTIEQIVEIHKNELMHERGWVDLLEIVVGGYASSDKEIPKPINKSGSFITEAEIKGENGRIVDVVSLSEDEEVEIVHSSLSKKAKGTVIKI